MVGQDMNLAPEMFTWDWGGRGVEGIKPGRGEKVFFETEKSEKNGERMGEKVLQQKSTQVLQVTTDKSGLKWPTSIWGIKPGQTLKKLIL